MFKCNWDIEVKTGDECSSWTELLRDSESRKVYLMESKPSTVHQRSDLSSGFLESRSQCPI